jgi:hypothetical protein
MASTQHPVRGVGLDPKGNSLIAIKEWLIRDPHSAQPEAYSDLSHSAACERPSNEEEIDDAPSIAEASEPSIDLMLDEHADQAVAKEFAGCRVMQGDEVQEGKSAVRKLLLCASACAVLLTAVAVCVLQVFPYGEQRSISSAWSQLKEWSSYESHAFFSNQDTGTVSQRSRNTAQSVSPSTTPGDAQSPSASDRSPSSTLLDTMSEDFGLVRRAARNAWNGFINWSSGELHAILPKKDIGAVSERSEPTVGSAQPAPVVNGPLTSEPQRQLDTTWEDLGFVQRAANGAWNRLRDWSSHQLQAVMPEKGIGTSSDRTAVAAGDPTPSAISNGVSPAISSDVTPSAISNDVAPAIKAQRASPADRPSSSELQHQLDAMTENLGTLQRMVAELTSRQEQMTKDIATLQTTQQSVSEKLSALPRSLVAGASRRSLRHRAY